MFYVFGTADSATENVVPSSQSEANVIGKFSTSVPITVPQWGRQISHHIDFGDDVCIIGALNLVSLICLVVASARLPLVFVNALHVLYEILFKGIFFRTV